jgi:N-6 DNA Methylase
VNADTEGKLLEMFATETANLVLARILLIRFFEDHGFFGLHRYVCNGGVEAFQKIRETFEHGYTRLLHLAYEKAQRLYAAAFDETELDWVFDTNNPGLSAAIEWAMYQLSRYDFTTVKGDILTGIYDRFLDREQRKRFGEYYTPPSIARFIIDSLALNDDDRLLDPACGSGTFLIERYQQTAGEDAERGIATYPQVVEALGRLAGNDLNTFSAVLAQIQLLWHVLSFRDDLLRGAEFPDIAVSDKSSSILQAELDVSSHGRWVELDQPIYGGVAGNPPYVRPERSGELDPVTTGYFGAPRSKPGNVEGWKGISAEANLYALFIFKALDAWCRKPDRWGGGAGRLGYVVPLAFCGTNENADLRSLFAPGGRWTIREIVDLEVIWRHIFDADVLPIILIAEARPPRLPIPPALLERGAKLPADLTLAHQVRANRLHLWLEARATKATARGDQKRTEGLHALIERNKTRWIPDKVIIRLADKSCIDFMDGLKRPKFDIAGLPTTSVDYADLFSPDGRILTRLNPERIRIIKKLRKNQHFSQALQPYWYKRRGADRGAVRITRPETGQQDWESREMISRGIVYAGGKSILASGGHTVYKAENILSGALHGVPQDSNVDISKARNRYLFDYPDILPNRMWAVAMIAVCPNAVAFDPRETVFTDTATVFGPRSDLTEFPFDLYFLSRVCMYFYVLASRMSYLNMNRSHIYPTNLRLLPWNEALGASANRLEALRPSLLSTCQTAFQTEAAMFAELEGLELPLLRDAVRASSGTKIVWSDSFLKAAEKVEVTDAIAISSGEAGQRLQVSSYTFDWLEINSEDLVVGLGAALMAWPGIRVDRETLLAMPIPVDNEGRTRFNEIVDRYRAGDHMKAIEAVIDQIDAIVGPALGLDSLDLSTIQADMVDDPFLKNIKPRYPASVTRLHGYRTGLDSSERYD